MPKLSSILQYSMEVLNYGFESHPSSSFFFSEKKELFGLVASPFFLVIEKSFHVITQLGV